MKKSYQRISEFYNTPDNPIKNNSVKKALATLLLMCACPAMIWAQKITVNGVVTDATTQETLPGAAVVLLTPKDSTQAAGATADLEGRFKLQDVKAGTYIMRVSYMGYQSQFKNLTLSKKTPTVNVGTIEMLEDSKVLKETEIVAKLAQMEMKADTFVYNADAFRMP